MLGDEGDPEGKDEIPISTFVYLEKRLEFLRRLREAGYGVRMHAYEYYVWKRGFVCLISIQPYLGRAYIYEIRWNRRESEEAARRAAEILKGMDKKLSIKIII